jgi:hypothetical protein
MNTNTFASFGVMRLAGVVVGLASLGACSSDGDFLFAKPSEVSGVIDLGEVTPADVTGLADVAGAVMYGEVGATGTSARGGITMSFRGTGGPVCLWVDPELVAWNTSVNTQQPVRNFIWPDNPFDDGDIDLAAGLSVYYSGTPGQEVGSFRILYQDQLGNRVPIELNECVIAGMNAPSGGRAGRGSPEYCTLQATQPGINYTLLLETWSTPLDDDILSYGLLVANGDCRDIVGAAPDECVITGETREHIEGGGLADEPVEGSVDLELAFCDYANNAESTLIYEFCVEEAKTKDCSVDRCFCGDPDSAPNPFPTDGLTDTDSP